MTAGDVPHFGGGIHNDAAKLNDLGRRVGMLEAVRYAAPLQYHATPAGALVSMQDDATAAADTGLLVTLTAKDFSGPFIAYSWQAVEATQVLSNPADPTSPLTIVYTLQDQTGGPGNSPVYHRRNIDLVVCPGPVTFGPDCFCVGQVAAVTDNHNGTSTWTFGQLKCCEDKTFDPATGNCADCPQTSPCPAAPLAVTAANGTYPTAVGTWAQLATVCHAGGDETVEACVYVIRPDPNGGDWYFLDHDPRVEFLQITAGPDANGNYSGFRIRYDQHSKQWFQVTPALILDAGSA